jgi:hypothetical protein
MEGLALLSAAQNLGRLVTPNAVSSEWISWLQFAASPKQNHWMVVPARTCVREWLGVCMCVCAHVTA